MPAAAGSLAQDLGPLGDRRRRLARDVGHAQAAADAQFFQLELVEKWDQYAPARARRPPERKSATRCEHARPQGCTPELGWRSRSTALAASPEARPKPNLESSWPVITYSWV